MTLTEVISAKLEMLSCGIRFDSEFLAYYAREQGLIERRRAYGMGDQALAVTRVPPEFWLDNGIICAVNHNPDSPWTLLREDDAFVVRNGKRSYPVTFPPSPTCYGKPLPTGKRVEQVLTVYGDCTLGLFSPGHCYFFDDDRECKFCSLGPAREHASDHLMKVTAQNAASAVQMAIELEPDRFRRVLLNGGTARELDKAFRSQVAILKNVQSLGLPPEFELDLISMPPRDLSLFDEFEPVGDRLAMSIEIFDPEIFATLCPGKDEDYGRQRFMDAYAAAVESLGKGRVYAGLVAGLEPLDSILTALDTFADMGVVPAVAVFHPDDQSKLISHPRPESDFLERVLEKMSQVYADNGFIPLIEGSGRNSLDTEAYRMGLNA
jgi:hypothetical protein